MVELKKIRNQEVDLGFLTSAGVRLVIKREDEIHPFVSGNKYRKLKYNLIEARKRGFKTLLTFGGAFSNHISAVAFAGKESGFDTIGIIRGDELGTDVNATLKQNPTLAVAFQHGMRLRFVSRAEYRVKHTPDFIAKLHREFGDFYLVPEGGTNALAVKGCEEILQPADTAFDIICCAVGTGGTISGLINSAKAHQYVLGFPALKGDFLQQEIVQYVTHQNNWELINRFHFGGFAKINRELITFVNRFKANTGVPLDPIYTGKMVYGIVEMIREGHFKSGTRILAIHTGGLQGIDGMNLRLALKGLPLIE